MKISIHKENIEQAAGAALNKMVQERESKPLLLLLSGGSSLNLLKYIYPSYLDSAITIGMLDDRYSEDPQVNSFTLIKATDFFKHAEEKGVIFLDSSVHENETLEQYAERYEKYIKDWLTQNPEGIMRATVGIGPDGHTSGILPFPENPILFDALFNAEKLIVGYDVGIKNPHRYRMTSTFTLIRMFDQVLTYMTGENKREALHKVKAESGTLAETPGRIARELNNVEIYTDINV